MGRCVKLLTGPYTHIIYQRLWSDVSVEFADSISGQAAEVRPIYKCYESAPTLCLRLPAPGLFLLFVQSSFHHCVLFNNAPFLAF